MLNDLPARADAAAASARGPEHIDLHRYVPAYLTWTANKLSRGASAFYLQHFGVGIEVWRCLVLLAVDGACSAHQVSRVIGLDKASVSRCFKRMQEDGLIRIELDHSDGRARIAVLTAQGRALH
ncbi:MAG: MarR family transcriptional regulator, partial [Comamonadaceae bacterium]